MRGAAWARSQSSAQPSTAGQREIGKAEPANRQTMSGKGRAGWVAYVVRRGPGSSRPIRRTAQRGSRHRQHRRRRGVLRAPTLRRTSTTRRLHASGKSRGPAERRGWGGGLAGATAFTGLAALADSDSRPGSGRGIGDSRRISHAGRGGSRRLGRSRASQAGARRASKGWMRDKGCQTDDRVRTFVHTEAWQPGREGLPSYAAGPRQHQPGIEMPG